MLVKYAVDAAAVWLATRQVWSPLDYLLPSTTLREPKLRLLPAWLIVAMLLWSLPFLALLVLIGKGWPKAAPPLPAPGRSASWR